MPDCTPNGGRGRCGRPGVRALHAGIVAVLTEGVVRGGSTMRDYVDARGERGGYLEVAAVYGRTGQPCRRCGTPIVKTTVGGPWDPRLPVVPDAPRGTGLQHEPDAAGRGR